MDADTDRFDGQDCMKFASIMQKSYFMGRKVGCLALLATQHLVALRRSSSDGDQTHQVVASLCRKERPFVEQMPKAP